MSDTFLRRIAIVVAALAVGSVAACRSEPCHLCEAAAAGDVEAVRRLLPQVPRTPSRAPTPDVDAALYSLATASTLERDHFPEIAALLLQAGADPNLDRRFRTTGRSRAYIVEDLAGMDDGKTLQAFVDAGLNVKGEPGAYALLKASMTRSEEAARVLLNAGADPGAVLGGTTAIDEARKNDDPRMLAVLERRGQR